MGVGTNLKKLRQRTKYSQQDIADMLNLDRNTYINWENETTDVKSKYIPQLADIFGVEINDLYSTDKLNITNNFETHDSSIGQKDLQQGIIINVTDKKTAEKLGLLIERLIEKLEN